MGKLTDAQKIKVVELYQQGIGSTTLSRLFGIDAGNILGLLKRRNILIYKNDRYRKYTCNDHCFDAVTPLSSYWLGFMLADGAVRPYSVRLELSTIDRHHIEKFLQFCESTHPIKENDECSYVSINSKKLVEQVAQFGLIQNKTSVVSTPNINSHLLSHFYRGYFDGDGWFTFRKSRRNGKYVLDSLIWEIGFSSGSEKMICEIHEWVKNQLNRKCGYLIHRHRNNGSVYQLTFGGNKLVKQIIELLYKDAGLYLDRKYEKSNQILEYINNHVDGRTTRWLTK